MTADEQEAVRTTECERCGATRGRRCISWSKYSGYGSKPPRSPHIARMRAWREASPETSAPVAQMTGDTSA